MLIRNSGDRAARHREKIATVLGFLGREKWSDFATINRLFGFKNHRGLYDLLNGLVAAGTLQKHRAGTFRLWSLAAGDLSRLSADSIRARLAGQNARFSFEAKGGTHWLSGDDITLPPGLTYRPAAVVTLEGRPVAVDIQTRMKTRARYRELLRHHLLARQQQAWYRVFWVFSCAHQRNAVRLIVKNIGDVTIDGVKYPLEAKHRAIFTYVTLDEQRGEGLSGVGTAS